MTITWFCVEHESRFQGMEERVVLLVINSSDSDGEYVLLVPVILGSRVLEVLVSSWGYCHQDSQSESY